MTHAVAILLGSVADLFVGLLGLMLRGPACPLVLRALTTPR